MSDTPDFCEASGLADPTVPGSTSDQAAKPKKNDADPEAPIKAASIVIDQLPKLLGAVVALSGLAYFIGWSVAVAYYRQLGAPWAVGLLSPHRLLAESSSILVAGLAAAFFSFMQLVAGVKVRTLFWAEVGLGLIASLLYLAPTAFESRITPTAAYLCAAAAVYLLAVSAGIVVAELIGKFALTGSQWNHHNLLLVWIFIIGLVFTAPSRLGHAQAERDLNPATSMLPTVLTAKEPNGPRWLLVAALDNQLVVMQDTTSEHPRRFRLISPADVIAIHTLTK
jgi:hypothetical protein